jgi:hypothetical protein
MRNAKAMCRQIGNLFTQVVEIVGMPVTRTPLTWSTVDTKDTMIPTSQFAAMMLAGPLGFTC